MADLRPYIGQYVNVGQTTLDQGAGPDRFYDCTLECLRRSAADLGFGHLYTDLQLRNDIRARYGDLGLGWDVSVVVANDLLPGLSAFMSLQSPGDVVATTRAEVNQGHIVHTGLWCDTAAHVPPQGQITYSHACRVVADLGNGFWLQNPEPYPDFTLYDSTMRGLYDGGGILVFTKSVLPAPLLFSGSGG